jgi:endoglucanase
MQKIADQPVAQWIGNWGNPEQAASAGTVAAEQAGAVAVLVAYNIPARDCGGYSSGNTSAAAYRAWIDGFAAGIGDRSAAVLLEPDGVTMVDCLPAAGQTERYELLRYAVERFQERPNVAVYIDGGHSSWLPAASLATRLVSAGIESARGFALNVSNFQFTADLIAYGKAVSAAIGGNPPPHFVIDTSRNGLGPWNGGAESWCNPPDRALGDPPTTTTAEPLLDAKLWVKPPGDSDGPCQGGPAAGGWWPEYALGLAQRAAW